MLEGITKEILMLIAGALVLGWLVAKFGVFLSNRAKEKLRDPKDDRIRSLEAEHRIALSEVGRNTDEIENLKTELAEVRKSLKEREDALDEQMGVISRSRSDLKESVKKTRELRAELSDRATENVHAEVKLREVETELEVTRASSDMIATGVLDYSVTTDGDDDEDASSIVKAAT
jgi:chromosome segregation ATPase